MTGAKSAIAGVGLWLLLMAVGVAQQAQAPTADPLVEAQRQLAAATQIVFDRDAEIVHLRTEIANCHATVDSLELGAQVTELVRRCEATFSLKCKWDDAQHRVVREALTKATEPPAR